MAIDFKDINEIITSEFAVEYLEVTWAIQRTQIEEDGSSVTELRYIDDESEGIIRLTEAKSERVFALLNIIEAAQSDLGEERVKDLSAFLLDQVFMAYNEEDEEDTPMGRDDSEDDKPFVEEGPVDPEILS